MDITAVIPHSDLPKTWCSGLGTVHWLATDDPEDFRKRGGHPVYGEGDVTYRFNRHGYRCPEFDADADVRMISIGCSNTLGVGLPQEALFHERFAERLRRQLAKTVVNWNLGVTGASNDAICRTLHLAIPALNPRIVLVNFTMPSRREYISVQNQIVNYVSVGQPQDRVTQEIYNHFQALSSPYDDQLNFFRNYKTIESLLRDRLWLFSTIFNPQKLADQVVGHINPAHYVGHYHAVDRARDGNHPGPKSHEQMYEGYWNKFVETNGIAALRA